MDPTITSRLEKLEERMRLLETLEERITRLEAVLPRVAALPGASAPEPKPPTNALTLAQKVSVSARSSRLARPWLSKARARASNNNEAKVSSSSPAARPNSQAEKTRRRTVKEWAVHIHPAGRF
jgi:hypothetical protein